MEKFISSPWGPVQFVTEYDEGIAFLTTASHGGFILSNARVRQLPTTYVEFAALWSKGWEQSPTFSNYFEEDCAALAVLVTWPELFPDIDPDDFISMRARLWSWVSD